MSDSNFFDPFAMAFNMLINGVGGTGVVTIGALITMAAHLDGHAASVLDFTGFNSFDLASSDELENAGVEEEDIEEVYLQELTFTVTQGDDLDFLDQVIFFEGSTRAVGVMRILLALVVWARFAAEVSPWNDNVRPDAGATRDPGLRLVEREGRPWLLWVGETRGSSSPWQIRIGVFAFFRW